MIDRIVIDNFKSIKHAEVKLQKINLLIGPNNSGKSNFLKGFIHVLNAYIGTSLPLFNNMFDENKDGLKTRFQFNIENNYYLNIDTHPNQTNYETTNTFGEFEKKINYQESSSKLFELINTTKIYKPDLAKLHHPYPIFQNDDTVLEDASNIASFLQTCLNKHRKYFNTITEELKKVLPVFDEIIIENVEQEEIVDKKGKKQLVNKIKIGFRDIGNRVIWAEDLSEGALYFLALLCIIHQPTPPKLLLIEEPERSIHPRRIKEVIDLIRQLSEEKDIQVIMTTHSPLVVDLFESEPESIHVFEMKDGFTEIKNLKTDIIDPINTELEENGIEPHKDYETTLGQQWVYGFLGGVPV